MIYEGKGPIVWEGVVEQTSSGPALMVDEPDGTPCLAIGTGGLVPENWRDGRRLVILVDKTDDPKRVRRTPWVLGLGRECFVKLGLEGCFIRLCADSDPGPSLKTFVAPSDACLDADQARELASALLRFASMAERP